MPVSLFELKIDGISKDEVISFCLERLKEKRSAFLLSLNTEILMLSERDPEFKKILQSADLTFADGVGILWAAGVKNPLQGFFRGLGSFFYKGLIRLPITEQVRGRELVFDLAKIAATQNYSIYLVGSKNGVAKTAADKLKERFPDLKIAAESGPEIWVPNSNQDQELVKRIKAFGPDILVLGFGAPKDEMFIALHKQELNVPILFGGGGSIDFIAGRQKPAPKFLADIGLEWLYRLIKEPKRIKRQLALPKFIFKVLFR